MMQGFGFGKGKDGENKSDLEGDRSAKDINRLMTSENLTSLQKKRLEKL